MSFILDALRKSGERAPAGGDGELFTRAFGAGPAPGAVVDLAADRPAVARADRAGGSLVAEQHAGTAGFADRDPGRRTGGRTGANATDAGSGVGADIGAHHGAGDSGCGNPASPADQ